MWVIQSNYVQETQLRPFVEALNELKIPFYDVGIIPFCDEFITPLPDLPENLSTNLIPYGSTSLMRIAIQRGWIGLFFDKETFRADVWNENRKDMLNKDSFYMTVAEAQRWASGLPEDSEWFIRPIEDLKAFSGTLTNAKEIARFTGTASGNFSFKPDLMCAISPPQEIKAEWRFFIVNGEVITGSSYRLHGERLVQRVEAGPVLDTANKMAKDWLPHPCCVMDVADTEHGMKVVEFNCLNASGIYYHDVKKLVERVTNFFNWIK